MKKEISLVIDNRTVPPTTNKVTLKFENNNERGPSFTIADQPLNREGPKTVVVLPDIGNIIRVRDFLNEAIAAS